MVPEIANLSYEKRLKSLGFTDLTTRRTRGDLIQMYKLTNKLEKVNFVNDLNYAPNSSLESGGYNLRTHNRVVHREIVRNCPARHNFFINRVTSVWNKWSNHIVNSLDVNIFKEIAALAR